MDLTTICVVHKSNKYHMPCKVVDWSVNQDTLPQLTFSFVFQHGIVLKIVLKLPKYKCVSNFQNKNNLPLNFPSKSQHKFLMRSSSSSISSITMWEITPPLWSILSPFADIFPLETYYPQWVLFCYHTMYYLDRCAWLFVYIGPTSMSVNNGLYINIVRLGAIDCLCMFGPRMRISLYIIWIVTNMNSTPCGMDTFMSPFAFIFPLETCPFRRGWIQVCYLW